VPIFILLGKSRPEGEKIKMRQALLVLERDEKVCWKVWKTALAVLMEVGKGSRKTKMENLGCPYGLNISN
jgi:hypothetical protein